MALFPYSFMRTIDGQEGYHIPNPRYGLDEEFPNTLAEITAAENAGHLPVEVKAIFQKLDPPIIHAVSVEEALSGNLPALYEILNHTESLGDVFVFFFTRALTSQEYTQLSTAVTNYKNYGLT